MVDYSSILTDPYNPIIIHGQTITFPSWLSDKTYSPKDFPTKINWSFEDHAINLHASFYDATVWYPWIREFTPESRFIDLSDGEIKDLIYEGEMSKEKKALVLSNIRDGFRFIKSSKKSSHFRRKVNDYDKFLEEITHPQVVMSFKDGCSHIFMRKYVDDIQEEYRIYVYKNAIRYVERYVRWKDVDFSKERLIEYLAKVCPKIRYEDYILDVASVTDGFICIEINTPPYLFAGFNNADYYFERDKIHLAETPIVRV